MTDVSTLLDTLEEFIRTPKRMPIADMNRENLIRYILTDYLSRLDDDELGKIEDNYKTIWKITNA